MHEGSTRQIDNRPFLASLFYMMVWQWGESIAKKTVRYICKYEGFRRQVGGGSWKLGNGGSFICWKLVTVLDCMAHTSAHGGGWVGGKDKVKRKLDGWYKKIHNKKGPGTFVVTYLYCCSCCCCCFCFPCWIEMRRWWRRWRNEK